MGKVGESGAVTEHSPLIRTLALQGGLCDSTGSLRGSGTSLQFILCAPDWPPCNAVKSHLESGSLLANALQERASRTATPLTPFRIVLESTERDANRIDASHVGRTSVREYRVSRSGAVFSAVI